MSQINSNGLNIYYNPTLAANAYLGDATYQLEGGGTLAPGATPEPGTWLMLGGSLAGLAALRRRKLAA